MTAYRAVLQRALAERRPQVPPRTDCFRWIDREVPDFTVDLFANVAILSLYREATEAEEKALAEEIGDVGALWAVYLKRRPRTAKRAATDSERTSPKLPVWGSDVDLLIVREQELQFEICPPNGLSVGLYLDARDARQWVRSHSEGRTVLNLFSYTCGFSVAARKGGATRAVSLDLSRKVLDWGGRNLALNGFPTEKHDLIAGECFEWMGRLAKKKERFDLVVLDPPSFSTSGKRRFSVAKDYPALVEKAAGLVAPKGTLLACTNLDGLGRPAFQAMVRQGLAGRGVKKQHALSASPIDHTPPSAFQALALELA